MNLQLLYEIIGYTASILVALSMAMNSLLKLRIANLFGAICFTTYGLLIGAYPIAAVNSFIAVINIAYLYRMLRARQYFTLLEVTEQTSFLQRFLSFHEKAIQQVDPQFVYTDSPSQLAFFMLHELTPVGLLIAQPTETSSAHILLDFVTPSHRSLKAGHFVYSESARRFRKKGIHRLTAEAVHPKHARYLERMGFTPQPTENGKRLYALAIM